MKKKLIFVFAFAVIGVSALVGAENASATSVYDNTLIPRSNLILTTAPSSYCADEKETIDLTYKWAEVLYGREMTDTFTGMSTQFRWNNGHDSTSFNDYMDGWDNKEYWGVMMDDGTSGAYIWWTDDPSAYGEFSGSALPGYSGLDIYTPTSGKKVWGVYITIDTGYGCDISVTKFMSGTTGQDTFYGGYNYGDGSAARKPLFIYLDSITYPSGYEGDIVPDTTPVMAEESDVVPDMYVSHTADWFATFSDRRFFTFDTVPWTCDDDLVPALHIEVWDRTADPEVMLDSGVFSASSEWTYQFDKKTISNDYRIVSWYECGDSPIFTESGIFDFTITGTGGLYTVGLETCLQESFPFFSYDSCISGINDMLAMLTFQMANPANASVLGVATSANPNNCHELATLGAWLHQEGTPVCPAFSSTIRSIVTPIITFVLGGMVFYWISRGRGVIIE